MSAPQLKDTNRNREQKWIAIIGFGTRAQTLVRDFQASLGDRIQVVAVADPDTTAVQERMNNLGLSSRIYTTAREMAEREHRIDGFIISSPDNCHLESFRAVAHLNKPILFEKPLEGKEENFYKLARELLPYQAPVLVGHCMRHAPILKKAGELIEQGWIGKVTSLRFVQNCHYGDVFFRGWHRNSETITSLFLEKATHDFDIMHMMNGDNYAETVFAFSKRYKFGGDKPDNLYCAECPEQVECPESLLNLYTAIRGEELLNAEKRVGRNKCVWAKEADISDDEMCMIEFSNGVQGVYIQTFYTPSSYRGRVYTIVGDKGVLDIDLGEYKGRIEFFPRYGTKNDRMVYVFDYLERNHYNGDTYLGRNFLGVMQGKEKPLTTVKAAIASELVGLAAVKSVRSKKLEQVDSV